MTQYPIIIYDIAHRVTVSLISNKGWLMKWENTKAKQVCDVCFGGDLVAMRRHAKIYLANGAGGVPALGAPFRELLPGRGRREFWEKALRQIENHLADASTTAGSDAMPEWTKLAGGSEAWRKWATRQAARCMRRAAKRDKKSTTAGRGLSRKQWKDAIIMAIKQSGGRGYFSRLPLTFVGRVETDPHWPSVEHLVNSSDPKVVIELRLFNDMKSICSEDEFLQAVGHLAAVLSAPAKKLPDDWRTARGFG